MAKYVLGDKEVTEEEFYKTLFKGVDEPFFLDEAIANGNKEENSSLEQHILAALSKGAYDFKLPVTGSIHNTGGTVFEKVQDYSLVGVDINFCKKDLTLSEEDNKKYFENLNKNTEPLDAYNAITGHSTRHKAAKDLVQKIIEQKENYGTQIDLPEFPDHSFITLQNIYSGNFNIPNKFTVEDIPEIGKKETEGKLDYSEINLNLLDLMAKRFMDNKVKYPKGNTLKEIDQNDILWAAFRHIRKMIKPVEGDNETYEDHLAAVATNMSIILDQLERK